MLWLLSGPPAFNCWISIALVFSSKYCWVLIFALSPFISWFIWCIAKLGVFHANQHLCVLIHIWIKGGVWRWNQFKPSSKILLLFVPRRYFFCGSFVLFMSCVCHAFASLHCCLVVTCWERAVLLALVCDVQLCFCHFLMWYPGSGVELYCIDSRSLPPFLL